MAAQLFYAQEGCVAQATAAATRLAGAKMRLWKAGALTPSFGTTLAQMDAAQCDFDGYAAGGIAVTPGAPLFGPGQAAAVSLGVQSFVMTSGGAGVGNVVGGAYLVTADNVLWVVEQFPDPVPIQQPGAGQMVNLSLLFPSG